MARHPVTPTVFISYSRQDLSQCAQLSQGLEQHGIRVQVDDVSIAQGSNLRESIRDLIAGSDAVICLLSASSLSSLWVIWEIRDLVESAPAGHFLPARLDDDLFRDDLVARVRQGVADRQRALKEEIGERLAQNGNIDDLSAIHTRINGLLNDLPGVVARLRDLAVIDLTPHRFERGFAAIYSAITGEDLPDVRIPLADSLDNAVYEAQRREILDDIANAELLLAASRTMDLLYQFFGNDRDSVLKATRLSGQIRLLSETYDKEQRKPGPLSVEFLAYYQKQVFDYADELMRLIPPVLQQAA